MKRLAIDFGRISLNRHLLLFLELACGTTTFPIQPFKSTVIASVASTQTNPAWCPHQAGDGQIWEPADAQRFHSPVHHRYFGAPYRRHGGLCLYQLAKRKAS